jgi:hypothetical protein
MSRHTERPAATSRPVPAGHPAAAMLTGDSQEQ